MEYHKHRCILKESLAVRTMLNKRFEKLKLSSRAITNDARDNGRQFTEQSLSRYRKHGNIKGSIQTDDVMWLCDKYNVELILKAKSKKHG